MKEAHPYIPHTEAEIERMLDVVGVASIEDLFEGIPEKLRLDRALHVPRALSEQELSAELSALAERNAHPGRYDWFLGAGAYAHFAPSAIDSLISRGEFMTAYTPYQAEMSQGTLQAVYEWQTMMASLTGCEVANASMYDGASAAAEAALMAMRTTRRNKVVVCDNLHPHARQVLETYLGGIDSELAWVPRAEDGRSDWDAAPLDGDTACLLVQQPGFLGCVEALDEAVRRAHDAGALVICAVQEALSLGVLAAPGRLGADIVCGEAQSFGVPLAFGGPHVGFLAASMRHVRQMPGRLVGETTDAQGRRGFVLTLSTREQHIRRERATSNICTNQGLCLLMATIHLSLLGPAGLARLARMNLAKAEYARRRVRETAGIELALSAPVFNEFAVRVPDSAPAALERALESGAVGGLDLEPYAPDLGPAVLVCTTELASREAIDRLCDALAGKGGSR